MVKQQKICPECGGRNGNHFKTCSRYVCSFCEECGGLGGKHYKTCSKSKVCQECGYSLQSHTHAKTCSHYKEKKRPVPCPECGVVRGHKKTCSHYKVTVCPECGSSRGHFVWCSHDKKCPECGYSIRSRTHAPTCSHYNAKKNAKREAKYQKTMLEKYGVANSYFMPGHAQKMLDFAMASSKHPSRTKINNAILYKLNQIGIDKVLAEYKLGNHWYDIYCEHNGNKLLIERNPSVSHNFDYDYMFVTGRSKKNKGGLDKYYHLNLSLEAEMYGYKLIHWYDWYDEDKIIDVIKRELGLLINIDAVDCVVKEVDRAISLEFINSNGLQQYAKRAYINIGLYHNDKLVYVACYEKARATALNKKLFDNYVDSCYELVRYSNLIGVNIDGALRAVQDHFNKMNATRFIIAKSDYNIADGSFMKDAGFGLVNKEIKPECCWNKCNTNIVVKNNLVLANIDKVLDELEIEHSDINKLRDIMDNSEIMLHYGFLRIYDSGYKTWLLKC